MGKSRNRKKCKRAKNINKENITLKLKTIKWELQIGEDFCRKNSTNDLFDNVGFLLLNIYK